MATPSSASVSTQAQQRDKYELPTYQPTRFPLSDKAIDALSSLGHGPEWATLEEQLRNLAQNLPGAAADINERMVDRRERERKRRRQEEADANTEDVDGLEESVNKMTQRMEVAMRKAIDSSKSIQQMRTALKEVNPRPATTSTQSSRRATQNVTQPGATAEDTVTSATQIFQARLTREMEMYEVKSHYMRYAKVPDFIQWKRLVHEAKYPTDQAPSLPPAETWFQDGGEGPAPGLALNGAGDDDDDDDIQISRANISTRCPLTLQEFDQPVKSAKCNHSYEKQAIVGLIRSQRPATRRGGGDSQAFTQEVECPCAGCHQKIGLDDLYKDLVLERKIRRIQRMKEIEEEQGGGHGNGDRGEGEEIASDSGDDVDVVASAPARRVKSEALSQRASVFDHQDKDEIEDEDEDEDEEMDGD